MRVLLVVKLTSQSGFLTSISWNLVTGFSLAHPLSSRLEFRLIDLSILDIWVGILGWDEDFPRLGTDELPLSIIDLFLPCPESAVVASNITISGGITLIDSFVPSNLGILASKSGDLDY